MNIHLQATSHGLRLLALATRIWIPRLQPLSPQGVFSDVAWGFNPGRSELARIIHQRGGMGGQIKAKLWETHNLPEASHDCPQDTA